MMDRINLWLLTLSTGLRREEGQTMAEYAVILTVITAAVLAALVLLSGNISTVIDAIAKKIVVS